MARKRYISTNISTDERVLELEERAGPYGVILYTWMIPHAADDGTITGRPRELKMLVVPGFPMTAAEVGTAVDAMIGLGLLERMSDALLRFPSQSFYTYQSYVKPDRRTNEIPHPFEPTSEPQRSSGQIQEIPGTSEKSLASFPVSVNAPVSLSSSLSAPPATPPVLAGASPPEPPPWDACLRAFGSYQPTADFRELVEANFGPRGYDWLRKEAMRMEGYYQQPSHRKHPPTTRNVWDWLERAVDRTGHAPPGSPSSNGQAMSEADEIAYYNREYAHLVAR